jgi:DNA-binding beta-propeller fold protein YncE
MNLLRHLPAATLLAIPAALHSSLAVADESSGSCERQGGAEFICDLSGPEDLVLVPQSHWVLVSGMGHSTTERQGTLYVIDSRTRQATTIYPAASAKIRHDKQRYAECPGPLDPARFAGHGIDLAPNAAGVPTLYVVNHGGRESLEIFEIDVKSAAPTATWVGCILYPQGTSGNGVAVLPDGGLATTNFFDPADKNAFQRMAAVEITGYVLEWHPGKGWEKVPGSEMSGPNGILASKDGKYLYVAAWPAKTVTRFARTEGWKKEVVDMGFMTDNMRWSADGSILAAGHDVDPSKIFLCQPPECYITTAIARLDPQTLKSKVILRYPGNASFAGGTTAIEVGKEIWLGSYQGTRLARFAVD